MTPLRLDDALGFRALELESLSFLDNVLTRYVPDNLVRSFVQDLDTAFAVREEGVRAEIQAEIQSIAAQLRSETERYRELMSFISEIRARVTQMRRSPSEFRISDPDRDLAAVRWGAELTDADRALMADLLNPLLSQLDETDVVRTCAEIVKIASEATDEGRSIAICVVLWTLGLFDRVVEVVNRFDRSQLQLPMSLELLRTGTRLRSGLPMSQAEINAHFAELLHRVQGEATRPQGRLLLGLGYLALLATHSHERWLKASLELSQRALDLFRDDVLGRAFAIHQCARTPVSQPVRRAHQERRRHRRDLQRRLHIHQRAVERHAGMKCASPAGGSKRSASKTARSTQRSASRAGCSF